MHHYCLTLILLCVACGDSHESADGGGAPTATDCVVRDTTGWTLQATPEERYCGEEPLELIDPRTHPVGCRDDLIPFGAWSVDQRVVSLLATCANDFGWFDRPSSWRPIVCESDRTCELLNQVGEQPAVCQAGLCQSVEKPLGHRDVLALCRAEVPRGDSIVRETQLAEEWCAPDGDRCEIPPECRQLE